jgi:ribulose-phosphate 3-epimerase
MINAVNPACHLEVDGGVDLQTCVTCKENGADVLVAGSAYFKAEDKASFVKEIEA